MPQLNPLEVDNLIDFHLGDCDYVVIGRPERNYLIAHGVYGQITTEAGPKCPADFIENLDEECPGKEWVLVCCHAAWVPSARLRDGSLLTPITDIPGTVDIVLDDDYTCASPMRMAMYFINQHVLSKTLNYPLCAIQPELSPCAMAIFVPGGINK